MHIKTNSYKNIKIITIFVMILNILLGSIKMFIGFISGSISIITDAFHTISDVLTSGFVLVGAIIASKPFDEEHPYGHGRAELLAGFAVSVILGVIGLEFLARGVMSIFNPKELDLDIWGLGVILLTGVIKEIMGIMTIRFGREYKSVSLISDAYHHRLDAWTSYGVAIGLLFQKRLPQIDGILAVFISLLIIYIALSMVINIGSSLLGERPTGEIVEIIREEVDKIGEVTNLHSIEVHKYGDHHEVVFHVEMSPQITLREAHKIITSLEEKIRGRIKGRVTIHFEPWIDDAE